jgi:hypothetical protein
MAIKRRFLLVEGIAGHPVTDPHNASANPARFAGWSPRVGEPHPDAEHLLDHYQPERQVLLDHPDLRGAIKRKHLTLHAECIARDHDAARAAFAPKPSSAARDTRNAPTSTP